MARPTPSDDNVQPASAAPHAAPSPPHPQTPAPDAPAPDAPAPDAPAQTDWLTRADTLRILADIVRAEGLSGLEVRRGHIRISLKAPHADAPLVVGDSSAAVSTTLGAATVAPTAPNASTAPAQGASAQGASAQGASTVADASLTPVVSPLVGIFYRGPSPNDPPFVEVGDHIEVGQVLAYVETMKVFNDILSEVEGTVVEIAAQNGQLVETGDRLMTIRKA